MYLLDRCSVTQYGVCWWAEARVKSSDMRTRMMPGNKMWRYAAYPTHGMAEVRPGRVLEQTAR